jgi:hypothetical protein
MPHDVFFVQAHHGDAGDGFQQELRLMEKGK